MVVDQPDDLMSRRSGGRTMGLVQYEDASEDECTRLGPAEKGRIRHDVGQMMPQQRHGMVGQICNNDP